MSHGIQCYDVMKISTKGGGYVIAGVCFWHNASKRYEQMHTKFSVNDFGVKYDVKLKLLTWCFREICCQTAPEGSPRLGQETCPVPH